MKKNFQAKMIVASLLFTATALLICCNSADEKKQAPAAEQPATAAIDPIQRGSYLVTMSVCDDCHSPKLMTAQGPVIDSSRRLSGHPADAKMPNIDFSLVAPGKWVLGAQDLTAWVGPWGVSFPANLTPDTATGTGAWTFELFKNIMHTGHHMGAPAARPILPPMPWQNFAKMNDDDLSAIFAYLKSLPPISNKVPDPLPPPPMKN